MSPAEQTVEQAKSELKRKSIVLPGDNKERNLRHTSKKRKQITVIPYKKRTRSAGTVTSITQTKQRLKQLPTAKKMYLGFEDNSDVC